ncbi:MAG: DoxX family protein [Woeseia sp.]
MFDQLPNTANNKSAGIIRILLGLVFFMAGILKVAVPYLGEAFSEQLIAANIPLYEVSLYTVPVVEMVLGITLLVGIHAHLWAAVAAVIMLVAAYVQVVTDYPSLFPLQPVEPVGPLVLLVLLLYVQWKGGGSWSIDFNETN